MLSGTVEILGGKERRRRWKVEEKLRIVAESHDPGASVRAVAARNDVYPSLLHNWRRQVRQGRLTARPVARFVPVRMAVEPPAPASPPVGNSVNGSETIEIELPDGCRLRVGSGVSATQLRRVVAALRG